MITDRVNHMERILWSIAFPGFGQILNEKLLKGLMLIGIEVIVNVKAHLNEVIIMSFQGNISQAVEQTNYEWLMFYPCIYIFAIWDAYRDSYGHRIPYAFLPFVSSAFSGTIAVVYSSVFRIRGILLGPVWFPIVCLSFGALVGSIIKSFILMFNRAN